MKKVEVDATGLACPQPVVMTKDALGKIEQGEVVVTVDSELARDNVKRMAQSEIDSMPEAGRLTIGGKRMA